MSAEQIHVVRGLTESEARRLSWSALQIAAVPPGPCFIPAVVVIARLLLDGDAAAFQVLDVATQRTLVGHADPEPPAPAYQSLPLTIDLPSRAGYQRVLSVWRVGPRFAPNDRLLLDCLRPHLVIAWNRCGAANHRLIELEWSATPVLRFGIDPRGKIERAGRERDREGSPLGSWLPPSDPERVLDGGLEIADDGSFRLYAAPTARGRAAGVNGWLLARPEPGGSDMFFWASPALASGPGDKALAAPAQRPTLAQVDRVALAWRLSTKQRLVVEELATGKGNKDIADALGCAEVTVEYHLTAVKKKVGAISRAALISRFWIDAHRVGALIRSAR